MAEAEGDAGLAVAEADGAGDIDAQIAPVADLNDFSLVAGKSRALSESVWGRDFLTASARFTDAEHVRLVEAGPALLAVPILGAFTFTQAHFKRIIINQRETPACHTRTVAMASSAFSRGATVNQRSDGPFDGGKRPRRYKRRST